MPDRLTCEETFARLNDYLDRELSPEEIRLVEVHLATCAACAREYRFEESFLREVRDKLRRIAMPPEVHRRIAESLVRARGAEGGGATLG